MDLTPLDQKVLIAVIAAGAAFLGALAGGAATMWGSWFQARAEHRRELLRLAAEAAIADHRETAASVRKLGKGTVYSVAVFAFFHREVLLQLDARTLTPESYAALVGRVRALASATASLGSPIESPEPTSHRLDAGAPSSPPSS